MKFDPMMLCAQVGEMAQEAGGESGGRHVAERTATLGGANTATECPGDVGALQPGRRSMSGAPGNRRPVHRLESTNALEKPPREEICWARDTPASKMP